MARGHAGAAGARLPRDTSSALERPWKNGTSRSAAGAGRRSEQSRKATCRLGPSRGSQAGKDRFFFDVYQARKAPLRFEGEERDRILQEETRAAIAQLKSEVAELEARAMPEPPMANAVEEGPTVEQKVFVRGDHNAEGEPAPKVFPAIIAGFDQVPVREGSGRLELAHWIASPENPLTARVMANRIWQKHFGEGIVRTPSNFGKLGSPPTHPQLLDWLAATFVEDGWSVKNMHRRIMLSNAYAMSSQASEAAANADPGNLWLSHFNRRRLDVEEVRDGMLAVDNSIDFTMGGTLQSGFGTDSENSSDRPERRPGHFQAADGLHPIKAGQSPDHAEPIRLRGRGDFDRQAPGDERGPAGPLHDEQRVRRRASRQSRGPATGDVWLERGGSRAGSLHESPVTAAGRQRAGRGNVLCRGVRFPVRGRVGPGMHGGATAGSCSHRTTSCT